VFAPVSCDLMSISPKLANSTPDDAHWSGRHERLRIQPEVLRRLISNYQHQLKFVVSRPEDLDEIESLLEELRADRSKVLLMPEGIDAGELRERGKWVAEICKGRGFRFSPRLHVHLYGNVRGT
jgi:7-carboxy-7-deazaguanine synthase